MRTIPATLSRYLRAHDLPQLEARRVRGGHRLSHAAHSHDTLSLGAIVQGHSQFRHRHRSLEVTQGDVVMIEPGAMHACNALSDADWGYDMVYLDSAWLAVQLDETTDDLPPLIRQISRDPVLHRSIMVLTDTLASADADRMERDAALALLVAELAKQMARAEPLRNAPPDALARAWQRLNDDWQHDLSLADLCQEAGCRTTSLIAGFRRHYATTPHAALIDLRVREARDRLRQGQPIAQVASDCGFADQAHLQRTFKKLLATTPGHYAEGSLPRHA